jgi:hypothetical protein
MKTENVKAFREVTFDLLRRSKNRAPLDTGTLRGSGFVEFEDDGLTGIVGYTEEYALRQHEELLWRHPKGGEPKYLERPFQENKQKYIDHIRDEIAKGAKK